MSDKTWIYREDIVGQRGKEDRDNRRREEEINMMHEKEMKFWFKISTLICSIQQRGK